MAATTDFAAARLRLKDRFFERVFVPGIDDRCGVAPGDAAVPVHLDFGGGIRRASGKYDNSQG